MNKEQHRILLIPVQLAYPPFLFNQFSSSVVQLYFLFSINLFGLAAIILLVGCCSGLY